ncbi:hypothetical protein HYU40_03790 [Candidatus Woesearchaeota archaeon]|nr:hypothetical protein [Candidatus Woesearchaeota archaeon]
MVGKAEESEEPMPEEVKTGADRLLDLVRRSKEVAMAAAAKELGASLQTVEAWANFLEEDGLVIVKYKFTTPYVAVPEIPKARQLGHESGLPAEGVEFSELKTELGSMRDILSKAGEEKTAGEFGLLKQTYYNLLSKLKGVHDRLVTQADIVPQKKAGLNELMRSLDEQLQEAASHASEGKFDYASSSYTRLYEQARLAIEELNKLYDQITTLQSIQATKDYKDLLGKAYELMQEGKIEEANDLYEKLKFAHQNLAKEFIEKKRQMEDDLVKLNKDLAKNVDQANLEKLKRAGERIALLLNAGNRLLRKGEFETAESYYQAIKHEYETLPPGFIDEKKEIQEKVLAFYSTLAREREKAIRQKFDRAARQVGELISQIQELLKDYKIEPAIQAYREVKQLYSSLPAGFLKEKAALQEKIVPLHTAITSIYTKESVSTLKTKSAEIATLLGAMNSHTARGELDEAEAAYEKVKRLYLKMPKGFLHEETTLQDQIVQAYEAYLKKAKQVETSSSSSTISNITKLLDKAEAQVKRKDFESANAAYSSVMALYNTLPPGFALQKSGVRERVLRLYKALLSEAPAMQAQIGLLPIAQQVEPPPATAAQKITSDVTPVYEPEKDVLPAPLHLTREVPVSELDWHSRQGAAGAETAVAEGTGAALPETADAEEEAVPQQETAAVEHDSGEAGSYGDEDIENIDKEIDDIEKKIEELKGLSKATVKFPQQ